MWESFRQAIINIKSSTGFKSILYYLKKIILLLNFSKKSPVKTKNK
jgi:hypothetical protein